MSDVGAVKHTPGPWTTGGIHNKDIYSSERAILATIYDTTGDDAGKGPKPVSAANARLIAAAPELLAALKDCLDELTGGTSNKLFDRIQAAQDAITRAKGSTTNTQPTSTGDDPSKATVSEDTESPTKK